MPTRSSPTPPSLLTPAAVLRGAGHGGVAEDVAEEADAVHALAPGQARRLVAPAGPAQLQVLRGRLWLTRPGEPDDHFLAAGDALALQPRDAIAPLVIEADGAEPARYRLLPLTAAAQAGPRAALRTRWQRWHAALRAQWLRLALRRGT